MKQLKQIDTALKNLRETASTAVKPGVVLTGSRQIQGLTLQARQAIRHSDRWLYPVVTKEIGDAPPQVRSAVIKGLKSHERALGDYMRKTMEDNQKTTGLALFSERDSIVRTRTANLLKVLDPRFHSEALSREEDDDYESAAEGFRG